MLLRLVVVSLVMMACSFEASEAAVNCTAALLGIDQCLSKPEEAASGKEYLDQLVIFNMPAINTLFKKLKNKGCIQASAWTDIQAYLKLFTPPKFMLKIYKSLKKAQKKTLQKSAVDPTNEKLRKQATAVTNSISAKLGTPTADEMNEIYEWSSALSEACALTPPM
uniref:Secreted protein n=1 Tax=Plectus sambesii TaxID=2011161 RepID=A0A914UU06_9BILA